jgi:hypothetical protein
MASMMAKELFVIENNVLCEPAMLGPRLREHLECQIGLEKSGMLFASGNSDDWQSVACDRLYIFTIDATSH